MPINLNLISDPKPTAADFPRRMWEDSDIPAEYRSYFNRYPKETIDYSHIIFVPQDRFQKYQKEYMLYRLEDQLIYLEKQSDGKIHSIIIEKNKIDCVNTSEELLEGSYTIFWTLGFTHHSITFMFNRCRKDLFEPFLNWFLDCGEVFDYRVVSGYDERPGNLLKEQPILYNYSKDAFRLGGIIGTWQWWDVKKTGFLIRRRNTRSACLHCGMERGNAVIWYRGNQVDTWYMFAGRVYAEIVPDKKEYNLLIRGRNQEIGTIARLEIHDGKWGRILH